MTEDILRTIPKISRYDFEELKEKALAYNATEEDLCNLGKWFEKYGAVEYWNGECYEIDNTHSLYPIYDELSDDYFELVGWEIR